MPTRAHHIRTARPRRGRFQKPRVFRASFEPLESRLLFAFGVTTGTTPTGQSTYVIDNGGDLKFSVIKGGTLSSTIHMGDISSILYKNQEMLATYAVTSRYSHYEQGLGSIATITTTIDPAGNWILVKCDDSAETSGAVIQYYAVRKNDNNIYMASLPIDVNNGPGEGRFIAYLDRNVFANPEAPSDNAGTTGAIEGSDVFGHADGTTTSKFYNMGRRMIDNVYHGLTGTANGTSVGAWMFMGNREHSAGGPFFKDIDFQSGSDVEIYNSIFTGHTQTEPYRQGLHVYSFHFTGGALPTTPDYSWLEPLNLQGWIPAAQRGTLTGTTSGVPAGRKITVALSNSTAQYWAYAAADGSYTISGIQSGTYTETLYMDELAVATQSVTINAGAPTIANIASTWTTPSTIFSIGTWDGTPLGFKNATPASPGGPAMIEIMHPSDVRMNPWGPTDYWVGTDTPDKFPLAQFKDVNNNTRITFSLDSTQASASRTLRIGSTLAFAGGRPYIVVNAGKPNSWTSALPAAPTDLNSRGITRGTWRGNNIIYSYSIPVSALIAGQNTIDIRVNSGSSGSGFLSPNMTFDAIDLLGPTTANQYPTVAAPAAAASPVNGTSVILSALGADDGTEPNLKYTWSSSGPAAVAFSANGTNGAKNATATFSKAGAYTFTCTISDALGFATHTTTTVIVNQTNAGFGIANPVTVLPGGLLQLTAGTIDQFGDIITTNANASFSLSSGQGSVTATGLFIAPTSPGITTVQASAPGNLSALRQITALDATAWYQANASSGTSLADSSGNNKTGNLVGSASFASGVGGNALNLSGGSATLPTGIVSGLTDFTIAAWINPSAISTWARVFDFGAGTSNYMFLTTSSGTGLRFAIRTSALSEQQINGPAISAGVWTHVAVTLSNGIGTLYVNGVAVASSDAITLTPSSLGNTNLNYLGDSQFASDPAYTGKIDDFRIYNTALASDQITQLATPSIIAVSASPSPVTGTTTNLFAQATDVSAGESALTYTWTTTGSPPAPVNFSTNGTNAAKNTIATFTAPGTYNFQVTVVNPATGATFADTDSVSVTVNQALSSIVVSPASVSLNEKATQQFTATAKDQFGASLPSQPTFTWSATSGTVDASGLYTAPFASGNFRVTATSGVVSGNASASVTLLPGDLDGNGQRTIADVSVLSTALTNFIAYQSQSGLTPTDALSIADASNDLQANNLDLQSLIVLLANAAAGGGGSIASSAATMNTPSSFASSPTPSDSLLVAAVTPSDSAVASNDSVTNSDEALHNGSSVVRPVAIDSPINLQPPHFEPPGAPRSIQLAALDRIFASLDDPSIPDRTPAPRIRHWRLADRDHIGHDVDRWRDTSLGQLDLATT
jgi:rhamnogalacturonan endolyase